jgi:uncharacterized protein (DUF1810 family)
MDDPFDLLRFIRAQDPLWGNVLAELRRGRKETHWMWFVFPQIRGLGLSAMSRRFAITGREEAEAYLAHPVLGPRLNEVTALVMGIERRSAHQIFGSPDDQKLRSCMTLFAAVAPDGCIFQAALRTYFAGQSDPATLENCRWRRLR